MRAAWRAELHRLEQAETLPAPEDFEALLTPPAVGVAWARRVQGERAWLLYRFDDVHVALWELTAHEPVLVEPE